MAAAQVYDSAQRPGLRAAAESVRLHHELVFLLARRDLESRYGGTMLGVWWTVATPLAYAGILSVVFSHVRRFTVSDVPFIAYVLSGIVVTTFVTNAVFATANAVTLNRVALRRVFVPVWVFVAASALVSLVSLTLTTAALVVVEVAAGQNVPPTVALLPLAFVLLVVGVAGFGVLLGSLAVVFADTFEGARVLLTILGFATPVFYPVSIVPHRFRWVVDANPLYHFVVLFRHLAYVGHLPGPATIAVCLVAPALTVAVGTFGFSRVRRHYPTVL
jgi:ABC-2 type transport system permease protein